MIFGNYPIDSGELVRELNERATQLAPRLDKMERNTAWTHAIKLSLAELARERGYRPLFTDTESKQSEFMLDQVWWQDSNSGSAAVLGVECEWGNPRERNCDVRAGCVADDFEKLLQFKAPMKLMVFTADNDSMRTAIHDILQRYIGRFRQHVKGEQYVFAEFSRGECFSYTCRIAQDGIDSSLVLIPSDERSAVILRKTA